MIAVVKSANCAPGNALCSSPGALIVPITEAIHDNHRNVSDGGVIVMADSQGRDGGCQGCHPAHRSDGDMAGYPITIEGDNFYAAVDNRDANGGCFVGRDVHSNPGKDTDGAETPEHLNAVGEWLADNVFNDGNSVNGGLWCTNCHQQLGQELWKAENMEDLVHGVGLNNPRGEPTLAAVAAAVGTTEAQAIAWLDPNADTIRWVTSPMPSGIRIRVCVTTFRVLLGLPRLIQPTMVMWQQWRLTSVAVAALAPMQLMLTHSQYLWTAVS